MNGEICFHVTGNVSHRTQQGWRREIGVFWAAGLLGVAFNDSFNIGRMERHVAYPQTKSAVFVDGPYPFGEEISLCPTLLIVLPLHFQGKHHAIGQLD